MSKPIINVIHPCNSVEDTKAVSPIPQGAELCVPGLGIHTPYGDILYCSSNHSVLPAGFCDYLSVHSKDNLRAETLVPLLSRA